MVFSVTCPAKHQINVFTFTDKGKGKYGAKKDDSRADSKETKRKKETTGETDVMDVLSKAKVDHFYNPSACKLRLHNPSNIPPLIGTGTRARIYPLILVSGVPFLIGGDTGSWGGSLYVRYLFT